MHSDRGDGRFDVYVIDLARVSLPESRFGWIRGGFSVAAKQIV
jgi:hypothetical protein